MYEIQCVECHDIIRFEGDPGNAYRFIRCAHSNYWVSHAHDSRMAMCEDELAQHAKLVEDEDSEKL